MGLLRHLLKPQVAINQYNQLAKFHIGSAEPRFVILTKTKWTPKRTCLAKTVHVLSICGYCRQAKISTVCHIHSSSRLLMAQEEDNAEQALAGSKTEGIFLAPSEYMTKELNLLNHLYKPEIPHKPTAERYVKPDMIQPEMFPPRREDVETFLKEAGPGDVLALIKAERDKLDGINLFLALKRLQAISLTITSVQMQDAYKDLLNSTEEFHVMCALLARRSPMYGPKMAYETVLAFERLGVDSTHPAMQVLLQLMKYHINDLDPIKLIKFGHSLHQLTPTQQTQLLLAGTGVWLKSNLNVHHLEYLTNLELLSVLKNFEEHVTDDIIEWTFEHFITKPWMINFHNACSLLMSMNRLGYDLKKLKEDCVQQLISSAEKLDPSQILSILESYIFNQYTFVEDKMSKDADTKETEGEFDDAHSPEEMIPVIEAHEEHPIDLILFQTLSQQCVDYHLPPVELAKIVPKFSKMCYFSSALVKDLMEQLVEEKEEILSKLSKDDVLGLIQCFCDTHHLVHRDTSFNLTLIEIIRSYADKLSESEKLNVAVAVCVLDLSYKADLLNSLRCTDNTGEVTKRHSEKLHLIKGNWQFSVVGKKKLIDRSTDATVDGCHKDLYFKHWLKIVSDGKYSVEDCQNPFVDYLLLPAQAISGKDVASNCYFQKIAILKRQQNDFFINTGEPKGELAFVTSQLQKQGMKVLLVNKDFWNSLESDREQEAYLSRRISEVVENLESGIHVDIADCKLR